MSHCYYPVPSEMYSYCFCLQIILPELYVYMFTYLCRTDCFTSDSVDTATAEKQKNRQKWIKQRNNGKQIIEKCDSVEKSVEHLLVEVCSSLTGLSVTAVLCICVCDKRFR